MVIFEVLSESTARTDLVTKNHEYAAIASVRRYIVLAQDEMAGTMFERIGDDWVGHLLNAASIAAHAGDRHRGGVGRTVPERRVPRGGTAVYPDRLIWIKVTAVSKPELWSL